MNGFNTFILLLINGCLIAGLMYVGDELVTSQRERARLRVEHREMMKMVDELRARIKYLEAF